MFIACDQDSPDADPHLPQLCINRASRAQIAFHQDNRFDGKRADRHRVIHHATLSQGLPGLPLGSIPQLREVEKKRGESTFRSLMRCPFNLTWPCFAPRWP